MTVRFDDLRLTWFGYATLRIETPEATNYLDPGRHGVLSGEWTPRTERVAASHPPASDYRDADGDLVCVTHLHHYDPDGIERVAARDATVLVPEGLSVHDTDRTDVRPADLPFEVRRVGTEDELVAAGVPTWTVPAYNDPDGPHTRTDGTPYHETGRGCGYLLAIDGTRVFVPGDTDVLPGHDRLDVDVFVPSIGGTYTMDRHGAADLALALDPGLVVPLHYDTIEAIETDARSFAADVAAGGVPVALDGLGGD